jgi:FAD:protein FMN transferase
MAPRVSPPPVLLGLEAMGTRFELVLGPGDPVRLHAIGEETLGEIARLDRQLSIYRPSSDVSWINARASQAPVKVEPRLFALLARCRALSSATEGAFDITVGPLMRAWGFVDAPGGLPDSSARRHAESCVGWKHLHLDPVARTVRFGRCGMSIDLGAVGKGYAVDSAIEILRNHDITAALLHGGTSSVHALGAPLDSAAWSIAWKSPEGVQRTFDLRDSALSVSAVHGKAFEAGGRTYGHVMNPVAGAPTTAARTVVVRGNASLECDALSTALLVLGAGWLSEFRRRFPRFEAVVA